MFFNIFLASLEKRLRGGVMKQNKIARFAMSNDFEINRFFFIAGLESQFTGNNDKLTRAH